MRAAVVSSSESPTVLASRVAEPPEYVKSPWSPSAISEAAIEVPRVVWRSPEETVRPVPTSSSNLSPAKWKKEEMWKSVVVADVVVELVAVNVVRVDDALETKPAPKFMVVEVDCSPVPSVRKG